jgi:hypothetical protein
LLCNHYSLGVFFFFFEREDIAMHDTEVDGEFGESVRCNHDIKAEAKATGFDEKDILSYFYFIIIIF